MSERTFRSNINYTINDRVSLYIPRDNNLKRQFLLNSLTVIAILKHDLLS